MFCGLTFNWNYEAGYVDMAISGYVTNALNRPQHTPKVSPQYPPIHHTGFKYFTRVTEQYEMAPDETPTLSKQVTTFVQYIVGSFLYYGISIDCTIIVYLNKTSLQQSKRTQKKEECQRLMDYLVTYPDIYIQYRYSDI